MSKLQELIEQYCPDGVEYKTLGELFVKRNGYTPSKSNSDYWKNGTVPWFRMEDIRANGTVLDDAIQHVTEKSLKKGGAFPANSIIVATSATIGAHALITCDFLCNQRFTCLTLRDEYADYFDLAFLNYYFVILDGYCLANVNQGSFASVKMGAFDRFRIPVPPIEVQREVVRILDEYTAAHDELVRQLEEEIGLQKKSDALLYQRFLDNWIAATSDVMMLKELVIPGRKISYGIVQPGEGGTGDLGVIRPVDIKNSNINVSEIKYVARSKEDGYQRTKLHGGEILVVVRGTTGEVAIVPDECKGMNVTRGIAVIAANESIVDRDYLFDYLRGESAQRYIASNTRGTALRQINIADLEKLKIPIFRDSLRETFTESRSKAKALTDAHKGLIGELSKAISLGDQQLSLLRNQLLSFPEKVA